ncbi:isopeptide-forming domain-containing fimbrial protein [Enterococcus sp. BWM-S5]|uniref:Isopeptide-forming domain-containing fimbrial protein n=1 Tax=Enterococcus larvae TaxID=2794352 RepID=A0ABS4CNM9_9ENTE|nr:isopeptide-forming domain-containing fimbrial protein [Enterococcus larvae]MBP1047877.1 isopeptide-forming domain-containing fimbrial protein [Enterococcus larvae]
MSLGNRFSKLRQIAVVTGLVAVLFCLGFSGSDKAYASSTTVSDWDGFVTALQTSTVSEINLSGDITKPASGSASPGTISRDVTINGNSHSINFFTGTTAPGNGIILGSVGQTTTLTLNNVDFHKYTTPATATFSGAGANWVINVNNVTSGTKTTAAQSALIDAAGAVVNISGNTQLRMNSAAGAPHIRATTLNVLDNANVVFNTSALRNGGAFQGETITVGKDATVDLGTWSVNGAAATNAFGINVTGAVTLEENAVIKAGTATAISANYTTIINAGSFTAKMGSKVETSSTSTYTRVIATTGDLTVESGAVITSSSTGANSTQLDATGAINVLNGGTLNLTANGATVSQVKSAAAEFIVREGANFNLEYTYAANTFSYSFNVKKFVVEDNVELKVTPTGSGSRIYGTGLVVGKDATLELASNNATSDAVVFLDEEAEVLIKEGAKVTITNNGTSNTVTTTGDLSAGSNGSHGIYGTISKFTLEPNSEMTINAFAVGYWTRTKNELNMSSGAVFNVHSKTREAVALAYDFGDGAHADKPATINISGLGTLLNMSSDNTSFTANNGATMRVQGDGATFNLTDEAELHSRNIRSSALQMQSQGSIFNVSGGAEMHLVKDSQGASDYNLGSTLRFRIRGQQTFNIDNGIVNIVSKNTTSFGIRMYGNDNHANVTNGGQLRISNEGYNGSADNDDRGGIEYTGTGSFNLSGENSLVDVYAAEGPAIYSSSTLSATAGPKTIYSLEGRSSGATNGGAINASTLIFELDAPKYFDLRNNRPGGGYALSGGSASTMVSKNSDLSVWKTGSNLDGNPFRAWSIFDYSLSGANFRNIVSTNVPAEFNTAADSYGSTGAQAYARMSANNAAAIIDEIRVPTNADKYVYGHVSVPEGIDDIRDAWTDEVYVEVVVKNPDGTTAFTTVGTTIGKDDTSAGLSVYGEEARGGMVKIPIPDGKFIQEGMTVEVVAAWRGGSDANSDRVHVSSPEDIQVGITTTIDVTPPTQAAVASGWSLTNATKQLTGTSDENGANVFVKVNGQWLKNSSGDVVTTTVSGGQWTLDLSAYLEKNDDVDVYLKDNTVIDPNPGYVLPDSYTQEPNGAYGNLNIDIHSYDSFIGYHDAVKTDTADERFDPSLHLMTIDVLPDSPTMTKGVKVYRNNAEVTTTQVGDTLLYTLTAKNDKADTIDTNWANVVITDGLPTGVDFDSASAELTVTVDGTSVTPDYNYDAGTHVLTVNVGDLSSQQDVVVTFKVTVNDSAVGTIVTNQASAIGDSPRETPFVAGPIDPNADHETYEVSSNAAAAPGNVFGTLQLVSAPNKIDFGVRETRSYGEFSAKKPTYDTPLVVSDSRATLTSWKLTATVTQVMTSLEDSSYLLPDALVYKSDGGGEVLELNQAKIITEHQHSSSGSYNVSEAEWENKDNGFELHLSANQYRKMSEYQAIILFTLSETP